MFLLQKFSVTAVIEVFLQFLADRTATQYDRLLA